MLLKLSCTTRLIVLSVALLLSHADATKGGSYSYRPSPTIGTVNRVSVNDETIRPQLFEMPSFVPNADYPEELEQVHERVPSSKPAQRIRAAVRTKHTFEYRPVAVDLQEDMAPRIIEVAANSVPLEIHFKSASSRIKLVQSHKADRLQEVERTSSDEEPQRLQHVVRKPIIQEVREIITPYRRIVQEIQPVMEEIHTIVSHEKERSKTRSQPLQQKQPKQQDNWTQSQSNYEQLRESASKSSWNAAVPVAKPITKRVGYHNAQPYQY